MPERRGASVLASRKQTIQRQRKEKIFQPFPRSPTGQRSRASSEHEVSEDSVRSAERARNEPCSRDRWAANRFKIQSPNDSPKAINAESPKRRPKRRGVAEGMDAR